MSEELIQLKNQATLHFQSLLLQETDPKKIAYLSEALRRIISITTIDDLISFLNSLQFDYLSTKEDYLSTKEDYLSTKEDYLSTKALSIFGGMPVLFRLIQNLVGNNYRYKYENFSRFSTDILSYFNTLERAKPYILALCPQFIFCPTGRFYFEMDYKEYDFSANEYIIGISFIFLKNTTQTNASVSLTTRLSSWTSYTQTYGGIFLDNNIIAEYTGSSAGNFYSGNLTIPPGTHILTCISGGCPYGNNYGYVYNLRHDIDLTLSNSVTFDYEAYRQILS